MRFKTLDDMDLAGKAVLARVDLNVPVEDGRVADDTRIRAIAPTVRDILAAGGRPVLLAHFGRPKGRADPDCSLSVVVGPLAAELGVPVAFAPDCVGGPAARAVSDLGDGGALLLENTRFHPGEEANDPAFAAALASLGDVFCNDAFSAAHRAHASTAGLAALLPSCAGRSMQAELAALEAALGSPARPVMAVVGGAKVSTKLDLLGNLVAKVDRLAIGGGMANTFLAAKGMDIGASLAERSMAEAARAILVRAAGEDCGILLPEDVVVARELAPGAERRTLPAGECPDGWMILDAGPATVASVSRAMEECRTLVWNGPLGAFETAPFDAATRAAASRAAELTRAGRLVSVAGGGDTVAALNRAGVAGDFSHVSTAGGAFLEWMEGKALPGVAALEA